MFAAVDSPVHVYCCSLSPDGQRHHERKRRELSWPKPSRGRCRYTQMADDIDGCTLSHKQCAANALQSVPSSNVTRCEVVTGVCDVRCE